MAFSLRSAAIIILIFVGTQHSVSQEQHSRMLSNGTFLSDISKKQRRVFNVAVSTNSAKIDLSELDCLALEPNWAHVDRIDHSEDDAMRNAVAAHFHQLSKDAGCRFAIHWTVVHRTTFAVRYQGHPSVTLMSFIICDKRSDGPAGQRCLSKNVWLFDKIISPADEYAVGIKAFVLSNKAEWTMINVSLNNE